MPASRQTRQNIGRMQRGRASITLPGTDTKINLPSRPGLLWYIGIGAMTAAELIEWPIALLLASTHFVEDHSRSRDIQELAEGIDAGS